MRLTIWQGLEKSSTENTPPAARPLLRPRSAAAAPVGKRCALPWRVRKGSIAMMRLDHKRLTYRQSGRDFRLTGVAGNVVKQIIA